MSNKLVDAMADLDEDAVLEEVKALRGRNVPTLEIIGYLQEGMNIVGKRYETKEYYLSELIMSAEIFKGLSSVLKEDFAQTSAPRYGTFVIATIYGDVHDIGKDIVTAVVGCNGFKVVDLGVDVPTAKFIEAIREHEPQIVGMSCLLTTAFDNMKEAIKAIGDAGLRNRLKILIGGDPVDESTRKYVDADAVCANPQEAVELSRKYVGGN